MKVRMMVHMSGTRSGQDWPPYGGVLEVNDEEGAQLCRASMAVPVVEARVERAVAPLPEVRAASGSSAGDSDAGPSELDRLRARAEVLGVKVDGRWQVARLREEIAKAQPQN